MKIGWIKAKEDTKSFKMWKNLGMDVFEIEELEKTDDMISELVKKHYHTIILSNEVASFSEDIIKGKKKKGQWSICRREDMLEKN